MSPSKKCSFPQKTGAVIMKIIYAILSIWLLSLVTGCARKTDNSPGERYVQGQDISKNQLRSWMGVWKSVKGVDLALSGSRESTLGDTMKIQPWEDGLLVVSDWVGSDGRRQHVESKFKADGKDYSENVATNRTVTGEIIGPISVTRIDDRTMFERDKPGNRFGDPFHMGFAWVLSGDGKYLTLTYVDTSLNQPVAGVTIYQKQ
jgi:hypothetical protein